MRADLEEFTNLAMQHKDDRDNIRTFAKSKLAETLALPKLGTSKTRTTAILHPPPCKSTAAVFSFTNFDIIHIMRMHSLCACTQFQIENLKRGFCTGVLVLSTTDMP